MNRIDPLRNTRLKSLASKTRFHRQKTMLYRSNLLLHTERVGYHVEALIPLAERVYGGRFRSNLARGISCVFDDFELDMGDYDPGERALIEEDIPGAMEQRRRAAHRYLAPKYRELFFQGIPYAVLIGAAFRRKGLEAQLVYYCDGFNGFGEALHELLAGNASFREPVSGYIKKQGDREQRYPELQELFSYDPEYFNVPKTFSVRGRQPTRETISTETGYHPYDLWIANILRYGEEKGLDSLVRKKEGLNSLREERIAV